MLRSGESNLRPNYVQIGILVLLAILSLAFVGSFIVWGRLNDSYNVVTQLYGGAYSDLVSQVMWYGIVPITAGLGSGFLGFLLERTFPADSSFSVPFFVFALPCMFWAIIHLVGTFNGYSGSISMSNLEYSGTVNSSIVNLYQLSGLTGMLWLFTGISLMILARKTEAF